MTHKQAINSGLNYIAKQQLQNGGFLSYSTPSQTNFSGAQAYHTTYFPSHILSALTVTNTKLSQTIKQNIGRFLLTQKSRAWSFNYWDRDSLQAKELPYPDDLDDTFCALSALQLFDHNLLGGKAIGAIAKLLIETEESEGGPYRTWLVSKSTDKNWQDIDLAVNANVGYFLHLQGVELPSIVTLIDRHIERGSLSSPYYPDNGALTYFITRWYRGVGVEKLQKLSSKNAPSTLSNALRISSLLRLGYPAQNLSSAIKELLHQQQSDGSWPVQAFCIDPMKNSKTHFAGAASLTTAFCIEALELYQNGISLTDDQYSSESLDYQIVLETVAQKIGSLRHKDLQARTLDIFERITKNGSDKQIVLLPWLIKDANKSKLENTILQQLACVSMWGWMAYTTYDDFLDGEGNKQLLPSANYCLRQLGLVLHTTLADNHAFQDEVQTIMNQLDAANAWEVSHCRGVVTKGIFSINQLPDYGNYWQLADRSLGHTISGLGVLYAGAYTSSSVTMEALRIFFKNYLIARQLNDDAHDWQEDLQLGHVNAVGVMILVQWLKAPNRSLAKIDLQKDLPDLQTIMWQDVIGSVCTDIKQHCENARSILNTPDVQLDCQVLQKLLVPLETAANEALQKRTIARDFISSL